MNHPHLHKTLSPSLNFNQDIEHKRLLKSLMNQEKDYPEISLKRNAELQIECEIQNDLQKQNDNMLMVDTISQKNTGQSPVSLQTDHSLTQDKIKNLKIKKQLDPNKSNPNSQGLNLNLNEETHHLSLNRFLKTQPQLAQQVRNLLYIQSKLDQHLTFLKSIRNTVTGLSFKQIKRKLWAGSQAFLSTKMLRQILFVVPHFYQMCYSSGMDGQFPFLVRLPMGAGSVDERRVEFKRLMYQYIVKARKQLVGQNKNTSKTNNNNNNSSGNNDRIQIPSADDSVFVTRSRVVVNSEQIVKQLESTKQKIFLLNQGKNNSFSALSILDSSKNFKATLFQMIKQKELQLKENIDRTISQLNSQCQKQTVLNN